MPVRPHSWKCLCSLRPWCNGPARHSASTSATVVCSRSRPISTRPVWADCSAPWSRDAVHRRLCSVQFFVFSTYQEDASKAASLALLVSSTTLDSDPSYPTSTPYDKEPRTSGWEPASLEDLVGSNNVFYFGILTEHSTSMGHLDSHPSTW